MLRLRERQKGARKHTRKKEISLNDGTVFRQEFGRCLCKRFFLKNVRIDDFRVVKRTDSESDTPETWYNSFCLIVLIQLHPYMWVASPRWTHFYKGISNFGPKSVTFCDGFLARCLCISRYRFPSSFFTCEVLC